MIISSNQIERSVSKEEILRKVSQADIFHFYLGIHPAPNALYTSPFRVDSKPTCGFYTRRGILYFRDFGNGNNFDCFNIVEEIYKLKYFTEALNKVYNDLPKIIEGKMRDATKFADLDFSLSKFTTLKEKEKVKIQIETRDFRDYDLVWWNTFGIQESTLRKYTVYAVHRAYKDGKIIYAENPKDPCYAYYFKESDSIKLYRPLNKKNKWLSNVPHEVLQGLDHLKYTTELIITKSLKDVMTLSEIGINAIAVQSETSLFPERLLKIIEDFKKREISVKILYDNDRPGLEAARKKSLEHNLPYIVIPDIYEAKDVSDFVAKYGLLELKNKFYEFEENQETIS